MELTDLLGACRVPLIGRRELLLEVEQRVRRGGSHLLYFEGEGGIGKTALLEAVLARTGRQRDDGDLLVGCVACQVIDLYHADVHTTEGLVRKIIGVTQEGAFPDTQALLAELDRARSVGNAEVANRKAESAQEAFVAEFVALAGEGVVLAFDTIEVLEHERDPTQEELGEQVPVLSAGEWLFRTFFPALAGKALVLLAGRPTHLGRRLDEWREEMAAVEVHRFRLGALSQAESRAYLASVADLEVEREDDDAARRLLDFGRERGGIVHFLTGGRPILLALVADMVAHGWTLPPSFGRTLGELRQRGTGAWQAEIERALVVRIQESPTPIGETIRTLAWLRKGATPELLARMMGLRTAGGGWDVDTAGGYLREAARLTLVKVRPGEGRVFLHDEMYALLERHVLATASDEERSRVYETVLAYCRDEIEALEARVGDPAAASPLLHAQLRHLRVEEMYYRLCHTPQLGFATYFWLAEQALDAADAEMDMLLRTELLRTVAWLQARGALADLDPWNVRIDGAVRWGVRVLFLRNQPDQAIDILERVYERWDRSLEALDLAWIHLQLYRAVARILRGEEGDWQEAQSLLETVEEATRKVLAEPSAPPTSAKGLFSWLRVPEPPSSSATPPADGAKQAGGEARRWRARMLEASALNYQGYLDRQQGRYMQAVGHYQASAMLQRRLALADLSSVLINLSYAMVLTGDFRHARLLTEEAEAWSRRGGGNSLALARALNARALVEVYDSHPRTALRYSGRALGIVAGFHAPRLLGLIYHTRARAHRYRIVSVTEEQGRLAPGAFDEALEEVSQVLGAFDEALKEANQAVNLLKNYPADRVAALIERGCMYREIARVYRLTGETVATVAAVDSSEADMRRAAILAGAMDLPDQAALAWINLAWLWYHVGQIEPAFEAMAEARSLIPAEYAFPEPLPEGRREGERWPPIAEGTRKDEARLPFWNILGKAEMLASYAALDGARVAKGAEQQGEYLRDAVRHATLSLAYDELVSDAHFELVRAEGSLHRRILDDEVSIGDLHRYADEAAHQHGLHQPTRFQEFLARMFGPASLWA